MCGESHGSSDAMKALVGKMDPILELPPRLPLDTLLEACCCSGDGCNDEKFVETCQQQVTVPPDAATMKNASVRLSISATLLVLFLVKLLLV